MYDLITLKRPIAVQAWRGADPEKPVTIFAKSLLGHRDPAVEIAGSQRVATFYAVAAYHLVAGNVVRVELGSVVNGFEPISTFYRLANREPLAVKLDQENIDGWQGVSDEHAETGRE